MYTYMTNQSTALIYWSVTCRHYLDHHRKTIFSLVNPQCSIPGHCFHLQAESKLLLYGLSVQPSKAECCPTAQVSKTQLNLMRLTNLLVVTHQLTGVCANITKQLRGALVIYTQNIDAYKTQGHVFLSTVPMLQVCQRGHTMHQTSSKQCRPTLSMAFASNPQDLARYSTTDNWPLLCFPVQN